MNSLFFLIIIQCKDITKLTIATISTVTSTKETYLDSITNNIEKSHHFYGDYEFQVNSQTYNGHDQLFALFNPKKVAIFYNPKNPNENMSIYSKFKITGIDIIIAFGFIIFAIFILPLLILL